VNSDALHYELSNRPGTDLVLIISDAVHQAVVRHGHYGIDPADYTPRADPSERSRHQGLDRRTPAQSQCLIRHMRSVAAQPAA
jgi:hypothetical protein